MKIEITFSDDSKQHCKVVHCRNRNHKIKLIIDNPLMNLDMLDLENKAFKQWRHSIPPDAPNFADSLAQMKLTRPNLAYVTGSLQYIVSGRPIRFHLVNRGHHLAVESAYKFPKQEYDLLKPIESIKTT